MSDKAYSRSLDKIIVRLPDGMRVRLAEAAASNKRSVNAEVVARLQASLDFSPIGALTPVEATNNLRALLGALEAHHDSSVSPSLKPDLGTLGAVIHPLSELIADAVAKRLQVGDRQDREVRPQITSDKISTGQVSASKIAASPLVKVEQARDVLAELAEIVRQSGGDPFRAKFEANEKTRALDLGQDATPSPPTRKRPSRAR